MFEITPLSHSCPHAPKLRKTRKIGYRLGEADFLRLAHRASTTDMSANQLARYLAISRTEQLVIEATRHCDPALLKQLYRIGHNLNQLVHNAHIFGRVSPQVDGLCQRIDTLMDEALEQEED